MSYYLRTEGILTKVSGPTLVERAFTQDLVFPEELSTTRVTIKREEGLVNLEILGEVPSRYVGKSVTLDSLYQELPDRKLFHQEFYVESERVINQAVLKRR